MIIPKRVGLPTYVPLLLVSLYVTSSVYAVGGCGEIGNQVWLDTNKDGVRGPLENYKNGVAGVTLTLTACDGTPQVDNPYITKADGRYSFTELLEGSYRVTANIANGYAFTTPNGTEEGSAIVNINGTEGSTDCITLNSHESNMNIDIGVVKTDVSLGSIGDTVFEDTNKNGVQDGAETGLSGATVKLFNAWSNPIASTTTDANGNYSFTDLAIQENGTGDVGCYKTEIVVPTTGALANAAITTADHRWACIANGAYDTEHDYGLKLDTSGSGGTGSIGNLFWHDVNGDGTKDANENGIPNGWLFLYDSKFNLINDGDGVLSDANGAYSFSNLGEGCYYVGAYAPKSGSFLSAEFTTETWVRACLLEGEQNNTIDFGMKGAGTVTTVLSNIDGTVWVDTDLDGVKDATEGGFVGATVSIFNDGDPSVVKLYTTDADGNYNFGQLEDGCYTVAISQTDEIKGFGNTTAKTFSNVCVSNGSTENRKFGLDKLGPTPNYCNSNHIHNGQLELREYDPENYYDKYELYGENGALLQTTTLEASNGTLLDPTPNRPQFGSVLLWWNGKQLERTSPPHASIIGKVFSIIGFNENGTRSPRFNCTRELVTPIALDLNGDGKIGVTGSSTARDADRSKLGKTVMFDMSGNGQAIEMEWFAGDGDGILIDNRDGMAASQMNGTRLFGDQGGRFANGYAQLAQLDTDGNAQLTGEELNGLAIWLDNGDAVVQQGELKTLASYEINSIGTQMMMVEGMMRSNATDNNGRNIMTEDVWFGVKR